MKAILLTLVSVLCLASAIPASAVQANQREMVAFLDAISTDPYQDAVQELRNMGILIGRPWDEAEGKGCVTRYELAIVVSRMMMYYEAALPPEIKLQPVSARVKDDMARLSGMAAVDYLVSRDVRVSPQMLADRDGPVTETEAAGVISEAFVRLIEMIVPGYEEEMFLRNQDSDSRDGHEH